jgi:superfamily II DNA or RNA helicase
MLARALQHDVAHSIRVKGVNYSRTGAVRDVVASERGVTATVRGTYDYRVAIDHESGGFVGTCECPYFSDRAQICKHIWALVLMPETERLLATRGPIPRRAWIDPGNPRSTPFRDAAIAAGSRQSPYLPWQHFLGEVRRAATVAPSAGPGVRPHRGEIVYLVDVPASVSQNGAVLAVMTRSKRRDGNWGKPKPLTIASHEVEQLAEESDREILSLLKGADRPASYGFDPVYPQSFLYMLDSTLQERLLPLAARTGRMQIAPAGRDQAASPVTMDEGMPWRFALTVVPASDHGYAIGGALERDGERMGPVEPVLVLAGGFLFTRATAARLLVDRTWPWLVQLRRSGTVSVPTAGVEDLIETLARSGLDSAAFPPELRYEMIAGTPRPAVLIRRQPPQFAYGRENLDVRVQFEYGGLLVSGSETTAYDPAHRRLVRRETADEQRAYDRLAALGFRQLWNHVEARQTLGIPADQFPQAVRVLVGEGWRVEAEGRLFRAPRDMQIEVKSGIDWFELHGRVEFAEGLSATLPELLAALDRGDGTLMLDDGTRGLVPEDWLRRFAGVVRFGETSGDHVRYRQSQAALLDALLASQPAIAIDKVFARARAALQTFDGIGPQDPPDSFAGHLREYQRDALGWLEFLRRFGFGGCLADDMGLGKTVMVLAMLESRRRSAQKDEGAPSLVVVPRSLVFNWTEEAARFAPGLRVLDYTGTGRSTGLVREHDLVLTTYGTLRRDAAQLKDVEFDYVILDEAQAIKNVTTASAKAARLLRGRHRLALSGTPVENHIGELWSLFDFLNPGMLGTAAAFQAGSAGRARTDPDDLALVAKAVRPFILRRTKQQVAPELPERNEQTIHCELEGAQRRLYDELREHYRRTLLSHVDRYGLNRSKIQVLEALLRLRQAACHAALVDERRVHDPSAKFDVLLPRLSELADEGHKALVFSQFTSFLALLRPHLESMGLPYEYLDGRTRDRAARVERFQTDVACPLFLISLRAGGLGLNLTGAEYVFLLDPWWNPAVEAQAIDRAHRIGQTRHVFAYRLIAKDTVEEKVAALQQSKRELADAILTADAGLIRNLSREDLEELLQC